MDLNKYQYKAARVAVYPGQGAISGLMYCALGLGESGEVQNKVKKNYRTGTYPTEDQALEIVKELGDILWYVSATATELGYTLDDVAKMNLEKLQSRKERGTLEGNGDNR
jgi:NTP pyrophosphatase (non-canonical NTP hydrolase)